MHQLKCHFPAQILLCCRPFVTRTVFRPFSATFFQLTHICYSQFERRLNFENPMQAVLAKRLMEKKRFHIVFSRCSVTHTFFSCCRHGICWDINLFAPASPRIISDKPVILLATHFAAEPHKSYATYKTAQKCQMLLNFLAKGMNFCWG